MGDRQFPEWAWPSDGDKVWVIGNHIFDCGHPDDVNGVEFYKTEIHPPRAIASFRDQFKTPRAAAPRVAVKAVDLFIHGRAGYITEQLNVGWTPLQIPGGPDLCLGSPLEPHRGTPIDTNFEFDVQLPPKPSPTAVLGMTFENGPATRSVRRPASRPCPRATIRAL